MASAEDRAADTVRGSETPFSGRALHGLLIVGVLLIAGLLAFEMSGSARRTLSTNQVKQVAFIAVLPHGGKVCEAQVSLPSGAGFANLEIGTYGRPVPAALLTYTTPDGQVLATGRLASGASQGEVDIPLATRRGAETGTLCVRFSGRDRLNFAGQVLPPSGATAQVNGKLASGYVAVRFLTADKRSWWQMLSALTRRFDYGKSGWIGNLTLPLVALAALAVWVIAVRALWGLRP